MLSEFHSYLFLRSITKEKSPIGTVDFVVVFKENFDVYYLIKNCNNLIFFIVKHEEIFNVINEMKILVKFSNFLLGNLQDCFIYFNSPSVTNCEIYQRF